MTRICGEEARRRSANQIVKHGRVVVLCCMRFNSIHTAHDCRYCPVLHYVQHNGCLAVLWVP